MAVYHKSAQALVFNGQVSKPVRSRPSYMDYAVWTARVKPFSGFNFKWRDGETKNEVKRRLRAEEEKFLDSLQVDEILPKGIFQKNNKEITQRHTRWLYRHKICGDSQPKIARLYHRNRGQKHRKKTHRRGATYVRGLLRKGLRTHRNS
jgi:hypothetical protein